ncbi:MAG TPA: ribonuclease H-like domain-containing protein [Armatimonadota bacterium]|jgi:hypothetical protein
MEALNGGPLRSPLPEGKEVDDLRRRLKKERPKAAATAQPMDPIVFSRDLPRTAAKPAPFRPCFGGSVVLEEAVAGEVVPCPRGSTAFVVTTRLTERDGSWRAVCEGFRRCLGDPETGLGRRVGGLCECAPQPHEVLLLDLETTGLTTGPMFLVGLLFWDGDGLVVKQYLARDYAEEAAIAWLSLEHLRASRLVVSFNGKTFDLPYLRTRAAANGVPYPPEPPHLDVLHEARRVWGRRLPNCKLQTLEKHLCGRGRTDDIPGAEIPDAYHAYVRTSNAFEIVSILEHNLLDLATLAELLTRLP